MAGRPMAGGSRRGRAWAAELGRSVRARARPLCGGAPSVLARRPPAAQGAVVRIWQCAPPGCRAAAAKGSFFWVSGGSKASQVSAASAADSGSDRGALCGCKGGEAARGARRNGPGARRAGAATPPPPRGLLGSARSCKEGRGARGPKERRSPEQTKWRKQPAPLAGAAKRELAAAGGGALGSARRRRRRPGAEIGEAVRKRGAGPRRPAQARQPVGPTGRARDACPERGGGQAARARARGSARARSGCRVRQAGAAGARVHACRPDRDP